ncbi:hypothetical protein NPIL_175111, partial [Nephila pilipes]
MSKTRFEIKIIVSKREERNHVDRPIKAKLVGVSSIRQPCDSLGLKESRIVLLKEPKATLDSDKSITSLNNLDDLEAEIENSLESHETIVFCWSGVNRYLEIFNKNPYVVLSNSNSNRE